MTNLNLGADEAILLQDSNIIYDRGKWNDSWGDKLILTNHALIAVKQKLLGGSEVFRFPLSEIKVVNGVPQAIRAKGDGGHYQLHVYFNHGVERFTLGLSDDQEESRSIVSALTSASDKEKQTIRMWCDAISCAVLGQPFRAESYGIPAAQPSTGSPVKDLIGTIAISAGLVAKPVSVNHRPAVAFVPKKEKLVEATKRCMGCMAPISGIQGTKATCRYCDTEQVI